MDNPMLIVLILFCIGVWILVFSGKSKIIEAIKEVSSKLDKLGDIEERLPEVDYEERDEKRLARDRRRWHEEDAAMFKRLLEAVSAAQGRGFTVELGNKDNHKTDWERIHIPTCRVGMSDGSTRYYFPVDFVNFALRDGFLESADMRDGKYPYNQPGQAQLEKLFSAGYSKD